MKIKKIDDFNDITEKDDMIILDPRHKQFKKQLQIAYYYKFDNPIIREDKKIKNSYLLLSKKEKNNPYHQFIKKIDFALTHYHLSNKVCSNYILLTEETVRYLEYYTKTHKFVINNKSEQREISGIFDIYPISDNVLEINIDKESVNTGELETTSHTNTVGSFHTHPFEAYVRHKVCVAFPSADDYFTTLHIYASGYGVFHITSTLEGLYIITIKNSFSKKVKKSDILKNFDDYQDDIEENYGMDYPICDPKKNQTAFWKKYIKKYIKKINKLKYFNVQFVFWKDCYKPIKIKYEKIHKNCLISDHQVNIIQNLNT
jgi:hypothetical protein